MEKEQKKSVYTVKGMSCNHCKARVENAIKGVEGVEKVEVELATGKTQVYGQHNSQEVVEAVTKIGFEVESEE